MQLIISIVGLILLLGFVYLIKAVKENTKSNREITEKMDVFLNIDNISEKICKLEKSVEYLNKLKI